MLVRLRGIGVCVWVRARVRVGVVVMELRACRERAYHRGLVFVD